MNKWKLTLGIAGALLIVYGVASPYIVAYQMKTAAQRYDGAALSEHIDFPSVRQSFKDQFAIILAKQAAQNDVEDNPFAALGAAFAGAVANKMVDAYVTPTGIVQLMAGEKPDAGKADGEPGDSGGQPFSNVSMAYQSPSKFLVSVKGKNDSTFKFVLRRRGLSWKVTEVLLPLEQMDQL